MYILSYLGGLVICAIATGVKTMTPEYGFLIIGIGLIILPIFTRFLHPIIKRITR